MRVLHFVTSVDSSAGGIATYMRLLAGELGRLCELTVAAFPGGDPLPIESARLRYLPGSPLSGRGAKTAWRDLLEEVKPDVVHVNSCWNPSNARIVFWSKAAGYKVVFSPHGMLEPWILKNHYLLRKIPALLLYERRALRLADRVVATAESERQNLITCDGLGWRKLFFAPKVKADKIRVVPNGIDVSAIKVKTSWTRTKNILFLSRVHPKKGIDMLIEAAAALKEELVGYTFVIAGEPFEGCDTELRALAERLGVAALFKFVGAVYGEAKWELYRGADLFVLPTHSENFGLVVAEALCSGTPALTTKGAPWGELETQRCGWWTEISAKSIEESLRAFLRTSESELENMGRRGRAMIEERYSAATVAGMMIKVYEELLGCDSV